MRRKNLYTAQLIDLIGGPCRDRTYDQLIKSYYCGRYIHFVRRMMVAGFQPISANFWIDSQTPE